MSPWARRGGRSRVVISIVGIDPATGQKLTSFDQTRQPFRNIGPGFVRQRRNAVTVGIIVTNGTRFDGPSGNGARAARTGRTWFDLGKSRQYPRTVARTRRYGCDPPVGDRAGTAKTYELTSGNHVPSPRLKRVAGSRVPGKTRERQPWPRASGPSSRTTAGAHGCTGSGCGCGPGPAGRSWPTGAPRVVAG